MYLEPTKALKGVRVIHENIDPAHIAEDFLAHEFIKMFPDADTEFQDKLRFHIRQYRNHYSKERFWRLIAGMSDAYMFKSYFRMLQGTQHKWIYAEVPVERVYTPMLNHDNTMIGDLMKKHDCLAIKVGEELRKLPWEERKLILEPFDLKRDNYPILMEAKEDKLTVIDGSRRAVNAAIYGMEYMDAYVAVEMSEGKPALREDFIADLFKVLRDANKIDTSLMYSFTTILKEYKRNYHNGPKLVDDYIRGSAFNVIDKAENVEDKDELRAMLEDVLEMDKVNDGEDIEKVGKNGKAKNKVAKSTVHTG
jgi:hypothetical protein